MRFYLVTGVAIGIFINILTLSNLRAKTEFSIKEAKCNISNPYSSGTGHYAGFEWAEQNSVTTCGGKSNSFDEGCLEYLKQVNKCKKEE